jgi:hypothetical protein
MIGCPRCGLEDFSNPSGCVGCVQHALEAERAAREKSVAEVEKWRQRAGAWQTQDGVWVSHADSVFKGCGEDVVEESAGYVKPWAIAGEHWYSAEAAARKEAKP